MKKSTLLLILSLLLVALVVSCLAVAALVVFYKGPAPSVAVEPTVGTSKTAPAQTTSAPIADFPSSSLFRRKVRGDTAIFYGKEGVTMEITPRLVRVEYGACRGAGIEKDIEIVVNDPAIASGDEGTNYIYAPSYREPGTLADWGSRMILWTASGPGVIIQGFPLSEFRRSTAEYERPVNGVDTQIYIAGYSRGRKLYELRKAQDFHTVTDPGEPYVSSMAGSPLPEVLVEGYWEVEFYIPDPPQNVDPNAKGFALGSLTTIDEGDHYYIVDAREYLSEDGTYCVKVWKISRATGETIAYGDEWVSPDDSQIQFFFTDGSELQP